MNDRREVVVRCFQVICLTNFFFLLSPSLSLTHTQTQKELWCFFVMVCFAAEEIWNTPRHLSVVSCMFLCVCVCVFECVFTEHVLNSQTHVRHSSPWHTAEVWLIKDEFRGSMTVLFAPPPPPTHPAAKRKDGMKDGERMKAEWERAGSTLITPGPHCEWAADPEWGMDGENRGMQRVHGERVGIHIFTTVWCLRCACVTIALFL